MRSKIFIYYLIFVALISATVAIFVLNQASSIYQEEVTHRLEHDAHFLSYMLSDPRWQAEHSLDDDNLTDLIHELFGTDSTGNRRITVYNNQGTILADSNREEANLENPAESPEINQALQNGWGDAIRKSALTGEKSLYYAYFDAERAQIIRITAPLNYLTVIRNTIIFNLTVGLIIGLFFSIIAARSFSAFMKRPIARLMRQYGMNDMDMPKSKDALGQLSFTLHKMTKQIEHTIVELRDRNVRVDTIINSMENGLVAVDREMHVIIINPVARRMFDVIDRENEIGKPLVHILRHRRLNELLEESVRTNRVLHEEVFMYQGGKRVLSISVSPIYPIDEGSVNSGALAFINDITSVRKLEDMRSEFVSNVTHELKTPLTSIRGFVETLKNGALDDSVVAEKFLDIIDIEADRLSTLINDILELSEIESMKQDKETDNFDLRSLVDDVQSMLETTAREKQITIYNKVDQDIKLNASRNRYKQLMINLMDNAVKYNKVNGTVEVWAVKSKGLLEIHVRDTGIGISEENRTRIFERFYRVDKGRSREMGGTGLGLSIVKHLANLYEGSVWVNSEVGQGSEFIISLPVRCDERNVV